jgi:hypothetical protein
MIGTDNHCTAYFISPHGYGHAARASAVMAAIAEQDPACRFEIFTKVPRWFFEDSLHQPFGYHALLTDIGLAQATPLVEDLPETLKRLGEFLPFGRSLLQELAAQINWLGCRLVLCDIAPMGIAVAREAGIPSVLIENFTWDWIYAGYLKDAPELDRYIAYLQKLFSGADYHIQAKPARRWGKPDLVTSPIGRKPRTFGSHTRRALGIPDQARAIMITMGGIPARYDFLEQLIDQTNTYFIIPGGEDQSEGDRLSNGPGRSFLSSNLVLLPHHSGFFHPDLVNASDAIIGKAGYSTLAEAYHAGVPFGYISRPKFRESEILAAYIKERMHGLPMSEAQLYNGQWRSAVEQLVSLPRLTVNNIHGADEAARFICGLLEHRS